MDNLEKIFDKAKQIILSAKEKKELRSFIVLHMKSVRAGNRGLLTYFVSPFGHPAISLAIISLVLISCAGISFAAEGSLPGDVLYPVKTGVNEQVRILLAGSKENKVSVLVSLAERRIEETEKLAADDRLNESAKDQIVKNFAKNTKKLNSEIRDLNSEDKVAAAADAASRIESSFNAHEEILSKLAEEKPKSGSEINSILDDVKTVSKSAKKARENVENDVLDKKNGRLKDVTEVRLSASKAAIGEAKKMLEESADLVDEEVWLGAQEMIKEAEDNLIFASSTDSEILDRLHKSAILSKQAKLMLQAQKKLQLKVLEFKDQNDSEEDEKEKSNSRF